MITKFGILGILLVVDEMLAQRVNNIERINSTSIRDHLKTKFGCVPLEKWNIMRWGNDAVEVACKSKHYKIRDEPKEIALSLIHI